ncbi:hypothetical protein POVWA2_039620 [Plasmodium ovale wallikeri]|uniref:Uncharacterized protein n=1 Tax=Plasmodium ovale wallikeri TaxID=864142 RepID=A0A1A8Z7Y9_PLAOA|nr:hypothetical protein POVWA1_041050 [Plasmodium ovale wallikeri]SBT40399.1 hypothetical protein POVWA2_039620 [Plasmodium ovale wallikeri]
MNPMTAKKWEKDFKKAHQQNLHFCKFSPFPIVHQGDEHPCDAAQKDIRLATSYAKHGREEMEKENKSATNSSCCFFQMLQLTISC